MRILNLYACLGGNRYKWDEVADIEVTAVELDSELARLYQERFPNDTVIVADAHQYLLDHYKEFDFIWSSPPCPTHSKARFAKRGRHLYWCNFNLPNDLRGRKYTIGGHDDEIRRMSRFHNFDFFRYKGKQRTDKIARNLVDYEVGKTILETALGIIKQKDITQLSIL